MKKIILILTMLFCLLAFVSPSGAWDPGGWDEQKISYIKKTAAPTVNDDDYGVPFLWVDETSDKFYLLIDNTAGAAVWQEVTYVGGSSTFTDLTATGNIQAATYGSGANPIPDATLLGIDDGTTDQILVGGGANTIPVWTTATGTGAPVRAESPTLGKATFQNTTDSTTGFQVLDADGGTPVLNVDTTNERVSIGTAVPQSLLDVQGPTGTGTATAGKLTLATKETTVVASDELGRINFNAPLEADGTDAILPGASIWAVAEGDFAADSNATSLVFATGASEAAAEKWRIDSTGALKALDSGSDQHIIKAVNEPGLGGRLTIGLDETARTMVIADAGDVDVDFGLGVEASPSMYVFNSAGTEYTRFHSSGLSADTVLHSQAPYFWFSLVQDLTSSNAFTFRAGSGKKLTDTDGEQSWLYVEPNINQSSTGAYNGLQIKVTETALGDGSTGTGATNNLIVAGTSGTADMFKVDNSGNVTATSFTADATATPSIAFSDSDDADGDIGGQIYFNETTTTAGAQIGGFHFQAMGAQGTAGTMEDFAHWDGSAQSLILPLSNDAVTPTLAIGAAGQGIYAVSEGELQVAVGGVSKMTIWSSGIGSATATGWGAFNETATSTNPTFLPYRSDADTGLGWAAADQLSAIAGSTEIMRFVEDAADYADTKVGTVYTPSADQARADDSTITIDNTIVRVAGDGAAATLDVAPAIEDGAADGQMVIIQGTDDTNTVTIADNVNCQLAGGASMVLGKGDTIQLIWDAGDSDWYEISRSDN